MKQMLLKVPEEFYERVVNDAKRMNMTLRDTVIERYNASRSLLTDDEIRTLVSSVREYVEPTLIDEVWLDYSASLPGEIMLIVGGDGVELFEKDISIAELVELGTAVSEALGRRVVAGNEPTVGWCSKERVEGFLRSRVKVYERTCNEIQQ